MGLWAPRDQAWGLCLSATTQGSEEGPPTSLRCQQEGRRGRVEGGGQLLAQSLPALGGGTPGEPECKSRGRPRMDLGP